MIEINGLTFSYNKKTPVINNLNFSINKNDIVGVLGHNGAGKSTLFKAILGLLKPQSGEIKIDESLKKNMGYLPETNGLYSRLTCYENLAFRAKIAHIEKSKIKEKCMDILEMVNLMDKKDSVASTLSNGMRKRIAFGGSIIGESPLILLDEPTNGLDPESLEILISIIKQLNKNNISFIINSHDLNTVEQLCNNVVVLQNGRDIYKGTAKDTSLKTLYFDVIKKEGAKA